jgi:transposase-like protein
MQPQQLFQWRRELREAQVGPGGEGFAAVRLIAGGGAGQQQEPEAAERDQHQHAGTAEIRFDNGRVLRVRETIAPTALMRLIAAVEQA